jgi:hypothetical protein
MATKLELELWGWDDEGVRRRFGLVRMTEVANDPRSGMVGMVVTGQDFASGPVVQVSLADSRSRPWKAVSDALQALYGKLSPLRNGQALVADGRCNGVTKIGDRCKIPSQGGTSFCLAHDPGSDRVQPFRKPVEDE